MIDLVELRRRIHAKTFADTPADASVALVKVSILDTLIDAVEAARLLYERVEMDESVGRCLSDRVPSLILGDVLAKFDFGETC